MPFLEMPLNLAAKVNRKDCVLALGATEDVANKTNPAKRPHSLFTIACQTSGEGAASARPCRLRMCAHHSAEDLGEHIRFRYVTKSAPPDSTAFKGV